MFDHILGEMTPSEKKRIRKLYKEILAGKVDIPTLNYDDTVRIEAKLQSELRCLETQSIQYEILMGRLLKREKRLLPIYDAVTSHLMLKEAEMIFEVYDDDDSAATSPPDEPEPPFCPWAVVDDRTLNLYLAICRSEQSIEDLDFADQCVVMSMKENRDRLSTFVAQLQSVIDAADEGKMNLNTLSFEDLQSLSKAIDPIIRK